MTQTEKKQRGIHLGFPFDQLLNRECPYLSGTTSQPDPVPGILLPNDVPMGSGDAPGSEEVSNDRVGTGNILICGPPGSAKSTLAIQFAVACANREINRGISAYVAFENSPEEICSKAAAFGWKNAFREMRDLHRLNDLSSPDDLAGSLEAFLMRSSEADKSLKAGKVPSAAEKRNAAGLESRVILTSLSPRPLTKGDVPQDIFWTRYAQLERFLQAAAQLRQRLKRSSTSAIQSRQPVWETESHGSNPPFPVDDPDMILRLVIVDSLNMFAERDLNREELFRLFSLFRRYRTIGVFVVETEHAPTFDSTLADVVISLSVGEDNGYSMRYFEVTKSRYQHQVYGRHPFRILKPEPNWYTPPIPARYEGTVPEVGDQPRHGVVVFPSLHYVVLRTESGDSV